MPQHGKIQKRNILHKGNSVKRKLFTYNEESLREALNQIRVNGMSIRGASRLCGVPRATIQDRLHGRRGDTLKKTGPQPILGIEGEKRIAEWAINIAKCGFPIKKENLIETVTQIARDKGILDLFPNKKPGIRWYKNFLQRHPEISVREAEGINKARAVVTEEFIRGWFNDLDAFLKNNNYQGIMESPQRIFNGDESGFAICPKSGKVLAPRGWKNLYQIKTGNDKENITVLIVFNASGAICPPLAIFPYVRPPKALIKGMPDNWIFAKSESGWMRSDVFYEYICNDFNKWLNDNNIQRPIILFIDGHKSHMTLPLSQFCEDNGIVLYALPPNTTHILQPADVGVFKPLKQEWRNTVRRWHSKSETTNAVVTKLNFCSVFQEAIEMTNMTACIKNGFRRCGLWPLNADAVDYTKCVKNTLEKQHSAVTKTDILGSTQPLSEEDFRSAKKVIKAVEDRLYQYGINVQVIINEIQQLEADDPKSQINISNETGKNNESVVDVGSIVSLSNVNILDVIVLNPSNESNSSFSNDSPVIHVNGSVVPETFETPDKSVDRIEQWPDLPDQVNFEIIPDGDIVEEVADKISNNEMPEQFLSSVPGEVISNTSISDTFVVHRTPEKRSLQFESTNNIVKVPSSDASPFSKHLVYPESVISAKNSERKEKLPSAISCKEWRKYYEKKEEEKRKKIVDVQKRKELREQNKQDQQTRKRKRTTKVNNNKKSEIKENSDAEKEIIKCSLCEEDLISDTEEDSEKNIGCDQCTRWYHLRCTIFGELPYAEVATKEYVCDICK